MTQTKHLPLLTDMPKVVPSDSPAIAKLREEYHKGSSAFDAACEAINFSRDGAILALRRGTLSAQKTCAIERVLLGVGPACSETAPALGPDPTDDELWAVLNWHYLNRGARELARQIDISISFLGRINKGTVAAPLWVRPYIADWLAGKGVDDPIPQKDKQIEFGLVVDEPEEVRPALVSWICERPKPEEIPQLGLPPAGPPKMDARSQMIRRMIAQRQQQRMAG